MTFERASRLPAVREVDAGQALDDLGAAQLSRTSSGWSFCCLSPGHADHNPSMTYSDDGLWGCWSCGASGRGLRQLVMLALDCSAADADRWLAVRPTVVARKRPVRERSDPWSVPTGPLSKRAVRYLEGRGIPRWFAERQGVAWYAGVRTRYLNCLIIPTEGGWWFARTTVAGREPPYLYPSGFPRAEILYGWQDVCRGRWTCVVEGVFDCWRVQLAGRPCVAVLGNRVSDAQRRLLSRFTRLVVLPDRDQGGDLLAARFRDWQGAEIVRCRRPDPGSCSPEELRRLIPSRTT